ncbi:MAG: serine hydrolase domain-containing protein [Candidatus Binataceae bacterium]
MPNRWVLASIALAGLVVSGCSHHKAASSKPSPPPPQSIDELRKAVADVLAKNHVPGVGIALVTKDKVIWTGGVGKADVASGRDVDADTMFRIGSITKGFVALSLLQLQEKGKISLDARVADVAPEVPIVNPWEQTDPVRIANLLEHTAGFDDFPLAELYDFSGESDVPLLKTLQMFPEPQHVRWRPGTFASYSNPDYGVAGYIVEKVTGQPFEQYVAENILRPLGMAHSDLRMTPEVKAALAQGYAIADINHPFVAHGHDGGLDGFLSPAVRRGNVRPSPGQLGQELRPLRARAHELVEANSIVDLSVQRHCRRLSGRF